ncbi:unnamed protein product, partial [Ascophyllum nodosum]
MARFTPGHSCFVESAKWVILGLAPERGRKLWWARQSVQVQQACLRAVVQLPLVPPEAHHIHPYPARIRRSISADGYGVSVTAPLKQDEEELGKKKRKRTSFVSRLNTIADAR